MVIAIVGVVGCSLVIRAAAAAGKINLIKEARQRDPRGSSECVALKTAICLPLKLA